MLKHFKLFFSSNKNLWDQVLVYSIGIVRSTKLVPKMIRGWLWHFYQRIEFASNKNMASKEVLTILREHLTLSNFGKLQPKKECPLLHIIV